jgi:hypothetical protein
MSKATGTASRKPQVFISYSGNDFDFADQLEKALLYGGFSITAGRHETLGLRPQTISAAGNSKRQHGLVSVRSA